MEKKRRPSPCILLKTGHKHLDPNLQVDPVIPNPPPPPTSRVTFTLGARGAGARGALGIVPRDKGHAGDPGKVQNPSRKKTLHRQAAVSDGGADPWFLVRSRAAGVEDGEAR